MAKEIKPSDFARVLKQDLHRLREATTAALYDEANKIITKSIPITPMDTGDLRDSAFVAVPQHDMNGASIELGYGGTASPYALTVHEMGVKPPKSINWSEPGTGAKYLEKPFDAAQRGMVSRLTANAYKRFLMRNTMLVKTHPERPQ